MIISQELRKGYFELTDDEKHDLNNAIRLSKQLIEENHSPDGYNIDMNYDKAARQTIFHFHCHVIRRHKGDMDDPRGGVRHLHGRERKVLIFWAKAKKRGRSC